MTAKHYIQDEHGNFVEVAPPTAEEIALERAYAKRIPEEILQPGFRIWIEKNEETLRGTAVRRVDGSESGSPWLGAGWLIEYGRGKSQRRRTAWDKDSYWSRTSTGEFVVCNFDGRRL